VAQVSAKAYNQVEGTETNAQDYFSNDNIMQLFACNSPESRQLNDSVAFMMRIRLSDTPSDIMTFTIPKGFCAAHPARPGSPEDNYLTTADAVEAAHTVLASDCINEQLAAIAGLPEEQMGLGHAFEMNPELENGFLFELAQAQMTREIFPNAPLKYMPPTKFMTGNIFRGHIQDALFNIIGIWTHQGLQLLGMPTEAIHTPFMSDRYLSIENAKYIFGNMKSIGEEMEFKKGGIIQSRAQKVLDDTIELLDKLQTEGLFTALEKGIFGDVKRSKTGGKGLNGVVRKGENYFNSFIPLMKDRKK